MTKDEFNDEAKRAEMVSRRLTAFGLYLTTYVTDKFRGIDHDGDGKISESEVFFHNEGYGGFHAMVRNYSVETLDVSGDPANGYQVTFTMDLAGPRDLLSLVDLKDAAEGGKGFEVKLPKGATVDPASVPRGEVRNFDPAKYSGELETIPCKIERCPMSGQRLPRLRPVHGRRRVRPDALLRPRLQHGPLRPAGEPLGLRAAARRRLHDAGLEVRGADRGQRRVHPQGQGQWQRGDHRGPHVPLGHVHDRPQAGSTTWPSPSSSPAMCSSTTATPARISGSIWTRPARRR
jgi:hypothetical protein